MWISHFLGGLFGIILGFVVVKSLDKPDYFVTKSTHPKMVRRLFQTKRSEEKNREVSEEEEEKKCDCLDGGYSD